MLGGIKFKNQCSTPQGSFGHPNCVGGPVKQELPFTRTPEPSSSPRTGLYRGGLKLWVCKDKNTHSPEPQNRPPLQEQALTGPLGSLRSTTVPDPSIKRETVESQMLLAKRTTPRSHWPNNASFLKTTQVYSHNFHSTLSCLIDIEAKRTKFINSEMEEFCRKNVICQRFSDKYSLQQNGLVERFNRTVIESLRTVILDSGLRPNLWNEVLSSCILALNQITTHQSKQSPYEFFKKSTIPIDFLKPIGNPVTVLSNQKKSKLEPRGDFGKLVGLSAEYQIRLDDGRFVNSKSMTEEDSSADEEDIAKLLAASSEAPEEVFIKKSEGSKRTAPYLKLVKSLYRLKQAPKSWYETLNSWFEEINYCPLWRSGNQWGFRGAGTQREREKGGGAEFETRGYSTHIGEGLSVTETVFLSTLSVSDACLFIHEEKNSFIFLHVDDLIVVGQTEAFEKLFLTRFSNSTAHSPDTLLGMNLTLKTNSIELSQPGLIRKGIEMLNLENCWLVQTPLTPSLQLHMAADEDHASFLKLQINYMSFTSMLNYLACQTCPDLTSVVSILSKFNQLPGLSHWKEVVHCWKNLKDQINFFTDTTWAEDQESCISRSERNRKYYHVFDQIRNECLKFKIEPTLFHIDNKGLLEKLKNFVSNSKTKHLDIKIKSLREKFKNEEIAVKLVPSKTKYVSG
ncbi:hypothetical protein VP01_2087g5 [Puccinia sorghi]|uniref:Integrase catalytic domain-containing protein n=1 Tax=Puccinia sorghi TaxID=27349 RepID=A0A0L6VAB1_9BASI|nr:hypothetical protein VP01_2087g5 [Puccinia sorghi]